MTDPVQRLIDAGAIPGAPFEPQSRYYGIPIAQLPQPAPADAIPYARRRFIPATPAPIAGFHTVMARDRPDLLGARYLGDPLSYWRIADANVVVDPNELTDTPGQRLVIPVVQGG